MSRRVVIIGAGITGSLLSWRLARAGWNVTLLEGRHVGAGSSSRTAAGIRQQFSTPENVVGMRYSVSFYRDFPRIVGGDTVPIVQNGYLFLHAHSEEWSQAQRRALMQQQVGLTELEVLEGEALNRAFPWVDRHAILGATFCPTDGFLRPETIYNEAVAAAVAAGARVVLNAPVTGCVRGDHIRAVQTPKGEFEADFFVDATNAWSPRLAQLLGGTALPIHPLKRYLWILESGGALPSETLQRMPLTIAPSGAYFRPENQTALLMGQAHAAPPEPDFSYEDQDRIEADFYHRSGTDGWPYVAWAGLAEAVPALAEFSGITATTSGYYGVTPDHNPFLDFDPEVPNLLRLVGFSGHGAMFGPFSTLVGAAMLEAGRSLDTLNVLDQEIPLGAFHIGRPVQHGEAMVI